MNALSCPEVEDHLDLYAAEECDGPTRAAVERHLADCPACTEALAKARQLQGLLAWRLREPEGLRRLHQRIEAEAGRRARPRVLPFARRFGSLAALLLVALGLAGWIGPRLGMEREERAELAVALRGLPNRGVPGMAVARMAPAEKVMKSQAAELDQFPVKTSREQLTYPLNMGGRTPEEFRRALRAGRTTGKLPPPPVVNLALELRNRGERAVRLDNWDAALQLDLRGPGAMTVPVRAAHVPPLEQQPVTLRPGESLLVPVRSLIYGPPGDVRYVYWTEPGDYQLRIRYETSGLLLTTAPVPIRVTK
jgi:hypothetical protein